MSSPCLRPQPATTTTTKLRRWRKQPHLACDHNLLRLQQPNWGGDADQTTTPCLRPTCYDDSNQTTLRLHVRGSGVHARRSVMSWLCRFRRPTIAIRRLYESERNIRTRGGCEIRFKKLFCMSLFVMCFFLFLYLSNVFQPDLTNYQHLWKCRNPNSI